MTDFLTLLYYNDDFDKSSLGIVIKRTLIVVFYVLSRSFVGSQQHQIAENETREHWQMGGNGIYFYLLCKKSIN